MTTATQTTRMTETQITDSGQVLGRAFYDDPAFTWILPADAKRSASLSWFMTAATKYGHRWGEVYTTGAAVEGNAIWLPPGEAHVPTLRMMQVGMWQAPFRMGLGAFRRFLAFLEYAEKLHEKNVPEPHWYLMVLGVDPPRQGQGVGGALIAPKLAQADAEGRACYLETAKERNVVFYRKHGFEVIDDENIPGGGPRNWTMKRAPRA